MIYGLQSLKFRDRPNISIMLETLGPRLIHLYYLCFYLKEKKNIADDFQM